MHERFPELVNALRQRLDFWGLKPEHKLAILSNTDSFEPLVDATYTAALTLGAQPVLLTIPYQHPFKDIPKFAEEALYNADFFIDLQHLTWFYSESCNRVLAALHEKGAITSGSGGREEDVETIIANVPTPTKVARAKKAQEWIDKATKIRVQTAEGSDFVVERGDPKTIPSYPSNLYGQVAFAPPPGTAEGVIEFVGNLRIQAPRPERFSVKQPVRMELEKGRIVGIDRTTPEGTYLDDWFRSFGREDSMNFAHVNLGLVPLSTSANDNESIHFAYGGVLCGFGIVGTPVFGTPVTDIPNHLDIHMKHASYWVDDVALLKDGEFTPESGLSLDPDESLV
jgi:hypothetical protein